MIPATSPGLRVNIAVCGRFHFHNYVRYIHEQGLLGRFFYSHRLSTGARALGVPAEHLANLWVTEYAYAAHARLLGGWKLRQATAFYTEVWQALVRSRWRRCDLLHMMVHGSAIRLARQAHAENAMVLGEPVNAHALDLHALLEDESDRQGLGRLEYTAVMRRQVDELELCDRLHVASHLLKRSYVAHGYPADRISVFSYGIDVERFSPGSRGDETARRSKFRVLCVGQISARKGQIYLLEAWKKLKLPNAELVLIGAIAPGMERVLRQYSDIFSHIAMVPNEDLPNHYRQADVMVLPSIEDGFSIVANEAMACGTPIIVTENNGASEVVENGKQGFVVPIRSTDEIASRLEFLYREPAAGREMGRVAADFCRARLSWQRYAIKLCEVYRSVVSGDEEVVPLSEAAVFASPQATSSP
jgi:glycosyltransferase involved in cell wall biosynthesis